MAINITGEKIVVKRIGDLTEVDNTKKHKLAAYKYNHIRVQFPSGDERHLLFTDATVKRAKYRASRNPEDLPETSWLWETLQTEIIDEERIADLQRIKNQKKFSAAAKTYNHIRVELNGENVSLLFTDDEIAKALNRADKNPEDLLEVSWFRDALD